jgi:hypothetical protein
MEASMSVEIDSLSDEEQKAIYERLHYKYSEEEKKHNKISDDQREAWRSVNEALNLPNVPIESYLKNRAIGLFAFQRGADALNGYVRGALNVRVKKAERLLIQAEALLILIEFMDKRRIPLTPVQVINNMEWLATAVDKELPGYAKARMLHMILPNAKLR